MFLDAAPLDAVGGIILDAENFLNGRALLTINPLIRFLESVTGLTHAYLSSDGTSFDAVATALASSLSSSSSNDIDANSMTDKDVAQSPLLLPPEKRARIWLCEFVDREVRHWATYLRNALKRPINKTDTDTEARRQEEERVEKQKKLDNLIDVYRQLISKFDNLPWSGTADQGLAALHNDDEQKKKKKNYQVTQIPSRASSPTSSLSKWWIDLSLRLVNLLRLGTRENSPSHPRRSNTKTAFITLCIGGACSSRVTESLEWGLVG